MEAKCKECGETLEMRDCPDCGGEGGGRNPPADMLDDGAWSCDRCGGEGKLLYCVECGEFREEEL